MEGHLGLTCDPDPLSGGGENPCGLCLGVGFGWCGKAQAQKHGMLCCKNTIYNRGGENLSQSLYHL